MTIVEKRKKERKALKVSLMLSEDNNFAWTDI